MQVKHGTTRIVFLVGRLAFKLPTVTSYRLFLHGLLANMQEAQWWQNLREPKAQRLMCPVKLYIPGGFLIVMPRCKPISRKTFFNCRPLNREFKNAGIPVENKLDSFGRYKKNIVAVDYGSSQ